MGLHGLKKNFTLGANENKSCVQDVDIKRQGAASAYAFVQYTDISSVVHALRKMEGEHIGANKIKVVLIAHVYFISF